MLITDGYEYFLFDKLNITRINWILVGKEIMPPLRDNWSQGYDKMNGDLEQLKKPNAQDQWMINDEWSDPKWKCTNIIN